MLSHRWTASTALAAVLTLACATPAAADPISTAIVTWATSAAFAASTAGAILIAASNFVLYTAATWGATKLFGPKAGGAGAAAAAERQASITTLSIGEAPRQAIFGRAGVGGSLADAVNWGGDNSTDWEGLAVVIADHRCEALDGVWIGDKYVDLTSFAGGAVADYNGQLEIHWRPGAPDDADFPEAYQGLSPALAPGALAGLAKVFVAYKADPPDSQAPIWSGRPSFVWVVKGLRLYDPRQDSTVPGGSGPHRWNDPATREWGANAELCRYNYQRGIYAQDLVEQPEMLLIGRGLSALEAPPQNIFAAANLCDEDAEIDEEGYEPRYRVGGVVTATESFGTVEDMFAAAMGGVIVQREGTVAVEPGQGKTPVASLTGADLVVGAPIQRSDFKSAADRVNTVLPRYPEPAQKWQEIAADVCRDLTDISLDGGAKEETLPLSLVPFRTQAKRLGEIRRRRARLERSMTVTLPPKWSHLEEGDWIDFTDDRLTSGQTITFEIVAFGLDAQWRNTVALAETSASVYGFGGAASNPTPSTPVPVPDALALSNVTATAIQIEGNDESLLPAIRFNWDTPVSAGITGIRAEVRKFGQTVAAHSPIDAVNAGQANVTNGVGWSATMEARLVPMGAPGRAIVPSPWLVVSTTGVSFALSEIDGLTPKALVALLRAVAAQGETSRAAIMDTAMSLLADAKAMAVKTMHNGLTVKQIVIDDTESFEIGDVSILKRTNLMGQVTDNGSAFQLNETTLKVSPTETLAQFRTAIAATFASTSASVTAESIARANADSALASSLNTVSTTVGGHTASITTLAESIDGLEAQWVLTVTSGNRIAGIRTHAGASSSSILFFADAIGFTDGSSNYFPLSISGGVVRMTNVEVDTIKAGSIVTSHLIGGAVSNMDGDIAPGDGASTTINAYGGRVLIIAYAELGTSTGAPAGIVARLYANDVEIAAGAVYCPGNWGNAGVSFPAFHQPSAGSVTYRIGCEATPLSGPHTVKKTSVVVTELKK